MAPHSRDAKNTEEAQRQIFNWDANVGREWLSEVVTHMISMYKEASPLVTPLGITRSFTRKGTKHVTRRISSALALIFIFSLGQFALALNSDARTNAATTEFAQDQNRREDRRNNYQGRRRHRRHRRHWIQQEDRRDNRNGYRRPS